MDDATLLADFARDRSEAAFQELVRRHVGMVYSVCYRQLRDAHWAEDVTQAVFILLARKAASLPGGVVLGGWLYRSAVYACSNARDLKRTRSYHEKLVTPMRITTEPDVVERAELEGLLDEGLLELSKAQREVLVLRFFENKPLTEVARIRGQSLYATQKALDSGMARLRRFMAQKGVAATTAIIAAVLIDQTVSAAVPAGLAASTAAAAVGSTSALSAYVSHLVAEMIRRAARAKLIASMAATAVVILIAAVGFEVGVRIWEGGAQPSSAAARVAAESAVQQAQEIEALWGTLRRAEAALRGMDAAGLSDVVAFTPQQADNWNVMARVFAADQTLKRVAQARFGAEAKDLTEIKTFGQRLDNVLPRIDPTSPQWEVGQSQAVLHFSYRNAQAAGGALYFVKQSGRWKIDAGQSMDVVLEGVNGLNARAAIQDLTPAEQSVVLQRMDELEKNLRSRAEEIQNGQLNDLGAVRSALLDADKTSTGRAFFWYALRFDSDEQVRQILAEGGPVMGVRP